MPQAKARVKKHIIGTGILTWNRSERISDRYGAIYLLESGDSTTPEKDTKYKPLDVGKFEGWHVTLKAHILETRESTHIGDVFRGVYPKTPNQGEVITLGKGLLFLDKSAHPATVGVYPQDQRKTDWLDIKALYRCHEQTVELFAEVKENPNAASKEASSN